MTQLEYRSASARVEWAAKTELPSPTLTGIPSGAWVRDSRAAHGESSLCGCWAYICAVAKEMTSIPVGTFQRQQLERGLPPEAAEWIQKSLPRKQMESVYPHNSKLHTQRPPASPLPVAEK